MGRMFLSAIIIGGLVLSSISMGYSGGEGTAEQPYRIATKADLLELADNTKDYNKCFILTADIDMQGQIFTTAIIVKNADLNQRGFIGTFDGDGHKITNFTINGGSDGCLGLFGHSSGIIKNLGLENYTISSSDSYYIGSLTGYNNGRITGCYTTGTVNCSSGFYIGGLAGESSYGNIINCYSTGDVNGGYNVGGLVGENDYEASIINCHSTGAVNGDSNVGGLVGNNLSDAGITNCHSTGAVSGDSDVGGLVGRNYTDDWWMEKAGSISHCYSTGTVSGDSNIGGLVGYNDDGNNVFSSFWDTETSGQATSAGGQGKTTAQMQNENTFLSAGWDFINETVNGTCNYWQIPPGGGYPVLSTLNGNIPPELSGSGTAEDPYVIADANDLGTVWYRPFSYYILANDINLAPIQWSTAIVPIFYGVFDGNGSSINNLSINGGVGYLGLFGNISEGQIRNLGLEDCNVSGTGFCIGALAAYNNFGSINNCSSTGIISSTSNVGGLVGYNSGSISNCYSTVDTNGTSDSQNVGGFVGYNYRNISNCYATGAVRGSSEVGGLAGNNSSWADISNCYSTGAVSGDSNVGGLVGYNDANVISSFWDTETSGQATSAGGQGRSTTEMQDANTFLIAGWDFANETSNGTCNYWQMPAGGGYPVFAILNGFIPAELSGCGTEQDPYIITDANDLGTIWYRPSAYYMLANDINLASIKWSAAVTPVFNGTLDGNGFNINNLLINGGGYLGLFGIGYFRSEVRNLGLENCTVNGNGYYVGSLMGCNYACNINNCYSTVNVSVDNYFCAGGLVGIISYGSISNCHSKGTINGSSNGMAVGGLVGYNLLGSVSDCYSTSDVNGKNWWVGGLVGHNPYGSIIDCCSAGVVSGYYRVGGLAGQNTFGNISGCCSTCKVSGNDVGGLVGRNYGNINNCCSTGDVNGISGVGGLVGSSYLVSRSVGSVSSCYSTGDVNGVYSVGGLIGVNGSNISNCYSTGASTGIDSGDYYNYGSIGGLVGRNSGSIANCYSADVVNGTLDIGGLIGYNDGNVVSCFWDIETSGLTISDGGTGKTTAQMQSKSTFTSAGWDFTTPVWIIKDKIDYPRLRWENSIPIANVGPNQTVYAWLDGFADVNLDGSASFDDDNDVLDFYWSWMVGPVSYEANGINPTVRLPAGEHTIELVVDDGIDLSEPNYCTITVIRPVRAMLTMSPHILQTRSIGRWIFATLFIPSVPGDEINTGEPLRLYPSGIEAKHQRFRRYGRYYNSRTIALAIFDKQQVIDALGIGRTEVSVVGEYMTGRYFFGSDTIRIIYRPWWWRWHW